MAPLTVGDFKQLSGRLEDTAEVKKNLKQFTFRLKNQVDSAGATGTCLQDLDGGGADRNAGDDDDAQGNQGPDALDQEAYRIRKCTLDKKKSIKSAAVSLWNDELRAGPDLFEGRTLSEKKDEEGYLLQLADVNLVEGSREKKTDDKGHA